MAGRRAGAGRQCSTTRTSSRSRTGACKTAPTLPWPSAWRGRPRLRGRGPPEERARGTRVSGVGRVSTEGEPLRRQNRECRWEKWTDINHHCVHLPTLSPPLLDRLFCLVDRRHQFGHHPPPGDHVGLGQLGLGLARRVAVNPLLQAACTTSRSARQSCKPIECTGYLSLTG